MTNEPNATFAENEVQEELGADASSAPTGPAALRRWALSSHATWPKAFMTSTGAFGIVWLLLVVVAALFAPWLAPYSPYAQDLTNTLQGSSTEHWLGTDNLGRDVYSRILHGASVSLWVPLLVVALSLLGALPLGLVAGYRGGRIDQVLMRVVDAGLSFPPLVLAMAVVGVLGPGLRNTAIALAFVFMPSLARLVRGQTLVIREESFIEASLTVGSPPLWIVVRRILPNIVPVIIVQATLIMATTLIAEASLSFLGLGAQPPDASWGSMLQQANSNSLFIQPTSLVWPGLALALTVLAFNSVGDSLSAALGQGTGVERTHWRKNRIRRQRGITAVDRRTADIPVDIDPSVCLDVRDLSVAVESDSGRLPVVEDISFTVNHGEIVGLVGESGSGKSVTSLSIMRLAPSPFVITSGQVTLGGKRLLSLDLKRMRKVRGAEASMVFQDPMSSLNPAQTVGTQLEEAVRLHGRVSRKQARARAVELLGRVGIPDPERRARSYPHQLSGGMRQRVMIAMALSCGPRLIIADEPTTALDVTIQAQVLQLLRELARTENVAIIFVTHDLAVVSELCDRVLVMYAGQIVEAASTEELFSAPQHPYSAGLIAASRHASGDASPIAIPGQVPRLDEMPRGCRFAQRCPHRQLECVRDVPELTAVVTMQSASPVLAPEGRISRCRRQSELELRGVQ